MPLITLFFSLLRAKRNEKIFTVSGGSFIGWFNGDTRWNFSNPVTEDLTLVARWNPPAGAINVNSQTGNNIVTRAVAYLNASPSAGGYTLFLDADIYVATANTLSSVNTGLTLIGFSAVRTIHNSVTPASSDLAHVTQVA